MAFDINQYFKTKGGNVSQDVSSIREAINALKSADGYSNNTAYQSWASKAESYLNQYEELGPGVQWTNKYSSDELLSRAYDWITGESQKTKAEAVWDGYESKVADIKEKIDNTVSNLKNMADFSGIDQTTGEAFTQEYMDSIVNGDRYQELSSWLEGYAETAEKFGYDITELTDVSKDPNGNWVPSSWNTMGEQNRTTGRTGETLTYRQDADGTYSVIGSDSGDVYQSGLKTIADVLAAQNQLNTGSTPQLTGQPTVFAATPTTAEELAAVASGQATVATPEQLAGITPTTASDSSIISDVNGAASGVSGTAGVGDGTTSATTYDQGSVESWLQQMGVDPSTLSADQLAALGAVQQAYMVNAEANQDVVPESLSAEDWDKFLASAKEEIDPYYQEQYSAAAKDLTTNIAYLSADYNYLQQQNAYAIEQQKRALENQMAEAGTARSGIRNKAQQELKTQQEGIVSSGRRAADQSLYGLMSQYEKTYGSQGLSNVSLPSLYTSANPWLGTSASTSTYTPLGTTYGTLGAEQETAEQTRANELAQNEMITRYGLTSNTWPTYS